MATRRDARQWGRYEVRGHIDRPDRKRAGNMDAIRRISLESLREVGRCENPLDSSPRVVGELVQLHTLVVTRRMEQHGCPPKLSPDTERQVKDYCRAVFRSTDNDHCRSARQWAFPTAAPEDPAKLIDGILVKAL